MAIFVCVILIRSFLTPIAMFFSTGAQYLPCPSRNESGLAGSRAACRASLCFSVEAGVCDEWAGDCRKRRTGLLARVLGSCWKKPSFPAESLTSCYLSFLFTFLPQLAIAKTWMVSPSPRGVGQRSWGKTPGAYDQGHHRKAIKT